MLAEMQGYVAIFRYKVSPPRDSEQIQCGQLHEQGSRRLCSARQVTLSTPGQSFPSLSCRQF